ncbi:hypothetical protein DFH27DRAFT_524542 [Peziza echinospora]|nr:hypothetical protein DFH27DRAFT_524542 [Peziza echinospora]
MVTMSWETLLDLAPKITGGIAWGLVREMNKRVKPVKEPTVVDICNVEEEPLGGRMVQDGRRRTDKTYSMNGSNVLYKPENLVVNFYSDGLIHTSIWIEVWYWGEGGYSSARQWEITRTTLVLEVILNPEKSGREEFGLEDVEYWELEMGLVERTNTILAKVINQTKSERELFDVEAENYDADEDSNPVDLGKSKSWIGATEVGPGSRFGKEGVVEDDQSDGKEGVVKDDWKSQLIKETMDMDCFEDEVRNNEEGIEVSCGGNGCLSCGGVVEEDTLLWSWRKEDEAFGFSHEDEELFFEKEIRDRKGKKGRKKIGTTGRNGRIRGINEDQDRAGLVDDSGEEPEEERREEPDGGGIVISEKYSARSGKGIWFQDRDEQNLAEEIVGGKITNQKAELWALLRALQMVDDEERVVLYTGFSLRSELC